MNGGVSPVNPRIVTKTKCIGLYSRKQEAESAMTSTIERLVEKLARLPGSPKRKATTNGKEEVSWYFKGMPWARCLGTYGFSVEEVRAGVACGDIYDETPALTRLQGLRDKGVRTSATDDDDGYDW